MDTEDTDNESLNDNASRPRNVSPSTISRSDEEEIDASTNGDSTGFFFASSWQIFLSIDNK